MRAFARDLGKYCTVVSTRQLKDAQESGISEATITVEVHVNVNGQGEAPRYKKLEVTEAKYVELKF